MRFSRVMFSFYTWQNCIGLVWSVTSSDGSGPKSMGPGRARALKVGLGPGPGLSPSMNAGPRALIGLEIYYVQQAKSSNFPALPQKSGSGPARAWALLQKSGSGPSKKHGPWAGPGPGSGPDPSLVTSTIHVKLQDITKIKISVHFVINWGPTL